MTDQAELLPGTLDLLILKAVSLGALHGYGVLIRIGQISGGALTIEHGVLYPALCRLQQRCARFARYAPQSVGCISQNHSRRSREQRRV